MKQFSLILSFLLLGLLLPSINLFTAKAISGWEVPEQLTINTANDILPSICFDGSKIAFESDVDGDSEIFVINSDSTGLTQLTTNTEGDYDPSISGDGSKIAFNSEVDSLDSELLVVNSDGSELTLLTSIFEYYSYAQYPSITYSGTQIVFSVDQELGSQICIVNSDSTGLDYLGYSSYGYNSHATISADGSKIAYEKFQLWQTTPPILEWDINIVNSDGSGLIQLTNNISDCRYPSISADGTKIAFQSDSDGDNEIFIINSDGTGLTQLTNNSADDTFPSISADGTKIAFQSEADGDAEIFLVTSDGSNWSSPVQLTSNTADDEHPSICGDGSKIAFQSNVDGDYEIYLISLESSFDWTVSLTATLGSYDDFSVFGVNEAATEGFDFDYDAVDPPSPPSGVVSYFYYPDNPTSPINLQKLCTSIISPAPLMTWTYKVYTLDTSDSLTISWSSAQIINIPSDKSVYLICPDDSVVNMRTETSYTFSSEDVTTYTFQVMVGGVNWNLDLDLGWNMVSFPCLPDDASFSSIFSGVPFYQVISWDGSGYVTSTVAEAGVGYWVLVIEEVTISIENAIPVTSYTKSLSVGWSMIGSVYGEAVNADDVFPGFYQLLTWDGSSYVAATTIEPGKGYWALVLEPTTITVG